MLEKNGLLAVEWHLFTKTFEFDDWCDRMKLPLEEKNSLSEMMIRSEAKAHKVFHIQVRDQQVFSFQGRSMLIKCVSES